jgi:phosphoenolpyruvate-protein phosphotransferase (PTS system enzyme I)
MTLDGFTVDISANISSEEELPGVLELNANGIGLFRTEFLYINNDVLPSEEMQFKIYKEVVEAMGERPIIIRTLDAGGDKNLPGLGLSEEHNPFLGWRAIRISLERRDIFKPQLRALLRASHYGNLKILFPMVSSLEEYREARKIVDEVKDELEREGVSFNRKIEVGIMIEVPAAALMAEQFAREVDFFSIGTNDLIQYVVAVDRTNDKVADLNNPCHPAVIRLIKEVVEAAHRAGIWVGVCGEAGGDPLLTPLFIAMGIDELSMNVGSVLEIKDLVRHLNRKECQQALNDVLKLSTAVDIKGYLQDLIQ